MKPILQLKNTQTLAMTPQLQQAIRLLQLSSIDLQQEIQNAVENNPMLEAADEEDINQKENFSGDSNDEKISQESLHENDNLDLDASFNSFLPETVSYLTRLRKPNTSPSRSI